MRTLTVFVDGIGIWAPGITDWAALQRVLSTGDIAAADANAKPAPAILPPTERRRAPEPVLLASEAASQAATMAGRDPATLPCVFTSTHGDLAITDQMCATLAADPRQLSPTRFHNSVHNAPAGYWCIATGCMASSTALTAGAATFGAGLLEAAVLAIAEDAPVLLVAYDLPATGPLADVVPVRTLFGCAFVVAPRSSRPVMNLRIALANSAAKLAPDATLLQSVDPGNPAMHALPLLRALARREATTLTVAAGPELSLNAEVFA